MYVLLRPSLVLRVSVSCAILLVVVVMDLAQLNAQAASKIEYTIPLGTAFVQLATLL